MLGTPAWAGTAAPAACRRCACAGTDAFPRLSLEALPHPFPCALGYTSQDADRLAAQLTADGALISSSLPDHTWLVLASPEALQPAAYKPHDLVSGNWQRQAVARSWCSARPPAWVISVVLGPSVI